MIWDDSRLDDLDSLEKLVRGMSALSSASGCLQRLAECVELAKKLDNTDWDERRPSFLSWLNQQAIADRQAAKSAEV